MLGRTLAIFVSLGFSAIVVAQAEETAIYELPGESTYPEGIAYDTSSGTFLVGSATDGTIFQGDSETSKITTFIKGSDGEPFATLGLKVDDRNQLWVAGGTSGKVRVYDIRAAKQIRTISTPGEGSPLLNDLVVTPSSDVYVTDSYRPTLFKISAENEMAEAWLNLTGTVFEYEDGVNANGIVVTPNESYLLVVQMNTGRLYRVDIASKEVSEVDLGGETLIGGDGLVLDGQTLYAVLQTGNEIVSVDLSEDFSSGTVTSRIQDESLAYPATAAKADNRLLVVNAQFDRMQSEEGPSLPFTVSSIPLSAF